MGLCQEMELSLSERFERGFQDAPQTCLPGISREKERLTQMGLKGCRRKGREMVDGQESHFGFISIRSFNYSSRVNAVHFPLAFTLIQIGFLTV